MTYDQDGNIIDNDSSFSRNDANKNHSNEYGDTNKDKQTYNDERIVASNFISPDLEQARQLVSTEFSRRGHPILGAVLAGAAYGLETVLTKSVKMGWLFGEPGHKPPHDDSYNQSKGK